MSATMDDKFQLLGTLVLVVVVAWSAYFVLSFLYPSNKYAKEIFATAVDLKIEPMGVGGYWLRCISAAFSIWSIIAFIYAEIEWDIKTPKDGGIGVGASAYALVLYARPIALACISAALALLSHGDLIVRWLRVSYRTGTPPENDGGTSS